MLIFSDQSCRGERRDPGVKLPRKKLELADDQKEADTGEIKTIVDKDDKPGASAAKTVKQFEGHAESDGMFVPNSKRNTRRTVTTDGGHHKGDSNVQLVFSKKSDFHKTVKPDAT